MIMRRFIFSFFLLVGFYLTAAASAETAGMRSETMTQDSIYTPEDSVKSSENRDFIDIDSIGGAQECSLPTADSTKECTKETAVNKDTTAFSKYDRRVYRYRRLWNFLIPTQFIMQYAGNMGVMSIGVGWDYGHHRQFETNLLFGYLPKFRSRDAKMTMTLKQNFIPWRLRLTDKCHIEPLSCGIYFNTVFGQEFWGKQPKRYPDKYYPMLSTKVRINAFVGQRISYAVHHNRRKFIKSISAFYEISTCDIYVRAMAQDSSIKLWDIIGLSLGLKMQML